MGRWTEEDKQEMKKEETYAIPANKGTKPESGDKSKPETRSPKFKITDPMVNEFINWVQTLDPDQYPRQAQQIRQNVGKNYRPSHLGAVIELFRMWLEVKGS